MKTKIYEAWKQHCELFKWKTQHIQLQAFIERLNNWMTLNEAIQKPRDYRWQKYKWFQFWWETDLQYIQKVLKRMQSDCNHLTTPEERERLWIIKAKHWLQNNISLYKLLSFLKNAHYITNKPQQEE